MAKSREENFYAVLKKNAGIKENKQEPTVAGTLISFERSNEGVAYGVIKENHHYYIKKSTKQGNSLGYEDFVYMSGLGNKTDYDYPKLSEAEKQRNYLIRSLNEAFDLGGVYHEVNKDAPGLVVKGDVNSFLHERIKSGKKNISDNYEKIFKSNLKENKKTIAKKRGLMPEAADYAVKKALGLLKEEDMVTADSEIKDGDKVSEKKGKEEAQAPINDKNAKAKADKATATGTADFNKKDGDGKSLAVNQADKKLSEGEDLVTADSELNPSESPVNVSGGKESAQAPINDENAKAEADKANASGGASAAIQNNVEESPESDPFDDKENAGDETGDIVTGEKKITEDTNKGVPFDKGTKNGSKNISTKDSDHTDADRVDNETKSEKTQAPYGAEKQPEKGHKEKKGTALKAGAKKDGVWESKDLSTADSKINTKDSPVNKATAPSTKKASEIVADSKENPKNSVANKTKTKLPNPIYEAEGEEELDAAAAALSDLDVATAEDEKEEEMSDEMPAQDAPELGGDDLDVDAIPADGGEELPAGDGVEGELDLDGGEGGLEGELDIDGAVDGAVDGAEDEGGDKVKEIEKNIGKANQAATDPDVQLDVDKTAELVNSVLGSFAKHISALDVEDKKKMADKIMKAEPSDGGEEGAPELGGEELPADDGGEMDGAIDSEISNLENGNDEVEEAEAAINDEMCGECGSFKEYAESRGYGDFNECSESEMTSLISGYANGFNEGKNEGGFEEVAPCVSDGVKQGLEEYGHGDYIGQLQPYLDNVQEDQKMSFGSFEPMVNIGEDDIEFEEPEGEVEPEGGEEVPMDVEMGGEEPMEEPEGEIGFATPAEVMGGGLPKPDGAGTKSVDVDLNAATVKVTVTEGEEKLKKYVRSRLDVLSGKAKSSINENKKSETLKNLDKMIEKQWNLFGETVKKKVS